MSIVQEISQAGQGVLYIDRKHVCQRLQELLRLGYSDPNSLYAKVWQDAKPMLVTAISQISHLFGDQLTRSSRQLKTCTVKNALRLRHGTFWHAKLANRFQKP